MPVAAIAAIGIGASVAGSVMSAKAAGPKKVANDPPRPVNPALNAEYLSASQQALPGLFGSLGEIASTGLPTDVGEAFDALVSAQQRFKQQGAENILEQFGSTGGRFGTPLMNMLQDYNTQSNKDFLSILADYTMKARESAAQRRLAATGLGIEAVGAPALQYYSPSQYVTGGQSAAGAGLQSLGQGLFSLALLKGGGFFDKK